MALSSFIPRHLQKRFDQNIYIYREHTLRKPVKMRLSVSSANFNKHKELKTFL